MKDSIESDEDWKLIGMLVTSRIKRDMVQLLARPTSPTQIRKELGITSSYASNVFRVLESSGLIRNLTPDVRKGRLFISTEKGQLLLKEAETIHKRGDFGPKNSNVPE